MLVVSALPPAGGGARSSVTPIHSDDETEHDAFLVQTCLGEVENAEYAAPLKPLLSTRGKDPPDEELDPPSRLREYVDSKMILLAKRLCYARPTLRSWPLKQGSIGDISGLRENLEQKKPPGNERWI